VGADDKATRPAGASLSMAGPIEPEQQHAAAAMAEPDHARPVTRAELHAMLDDAGVRDVATLARALRRGKSSVLVGTLSMAVGAGAGFGGAYLREPASPSMSDHHGPEPEDQPEHDRRRAHEGPGQEHEQPRRRADEPELEREQCEAARAQCEAADASERRCTREARRVVTMLDAIADECGIEPAMRGSEPALIGGPFSSTPPASTTQNYPREAP